MTGHVSRLEASFRSLTQLGRGPVARGSIISIVIRIAALGLGFVQAVLTARLLGPEGYGIVAVALSVATILATFATLGFGQLAVREVARYSTQQDWPSLRGFLRFSAIVVMSGSVVVAAVLAVFVLGTELVADQYKLAVGIASLLIFPLAMLAHMRGVLQGFGRVCAAQFPGDLLRPIVLVGCLGFLFLYRKPVTPTDYIIIYLSSAFIAFIFSKIILYYTVNTVAIDKSHKRINEPRVWLRSAAPFFFIFAIGVIGTEANTLLLGFLAGPAEAGLFQPVARLTPIMIIVNEALAMPLAPRLAALWEQRNLKSIRNLYRIATPFGTLGTVMIVVALVGFSPSIFSAFGRDFLVNTHLLLWIGLAQIVSAGTGAAAQLLAMAGAMRLRMLAQIFTLVVQLGLGALLIGPFGAEGAAMALVGAILVWGFAHWLFVRISLGIDTSLLSIGARK